MTAIKSYRRFLMDLHGGLVQAIVDAENAEWHHEGPETAVWQHYARLLTWVTELEVRLAYYDIARVRGGWARVKRQAREAEAWNILERYGGQHDRELGDADRARLDG